MIEIVNKYEKVVYAVLMALLMLVLAASAMVASDPVITRRSLRSPRSIMAIVCEDNGEGIPEEYKEAIFNRQHFKNTGFGLFLSREILGITSLSIRETGEPGKGGRFEISVPLGYFRVEGQAV